MIIELAGRSYTINFIQSGVELFQKLATEKPKFFTYDTETTGLHVKADKPFLGAICFKNQVYLFDTTYDILRWFPRWCKEVQKVVMHNAAFDLNMTANIIGVEETLQTDNFMDTQALVLLSTESISENRGGIILKLKTLATQYIDPEANKYEVALKRELKRLESERQKLLTVYIKDVVKPNQEIEYGKNGKPKKLKSYTRKEFDELQKNGNLPTELQEVYDIWLEENPKPTYEDVPEEILYPYLAADVILTQLLAEKCMPIVRERGQAKAMKIENEIIPEVVRMGRVGMDVDHEYLDESGERLEAAIKRSYKELHALTGEEWTVSQHAKVKKYYESLGYVLEGTASEILEDIPIRQSELIIKLRTLEKWLSTYVRKIQRDCLYDGRFYSMLNPFKAVSGRFSGDSQQFPKNAIKDEDGTELFHPRRVFKGEWIYQDFSQVELRVAAHWTTFFGYDENLCKAYMPYTCYHYQTGQGYDPKDLSMRDAWKWFREGYPKDMHWEDLLKNGWSVWVDPKTKEYWKPTDLHQATADKAVQFLESKDMHEAINRYDKKTWRQLGKRANFLLLYQGTVKALMKAIKIDEVVATALYKGFKETFPALETYAQMVTRQMNARGFCTNVYGRHYFLSDPRQFYCIANYLIQGTCGYDLKVKMTKIGRYLRSVKAKTQMVLCIHDEIIFTKVDGEEHHIAKIVEIMEDSSSLNIPLVSEGEVTTTFWSEKKKVA